MDKSEPLEMDIFGLTGGKVLFLGTQSMSLFIWLKHLNFHEELLAPYCLESAGLVNQGHLSFPSQDLVMRPSYTSGTDAGSS